MSCETPDQSLIQAGHFPFTFCGLIRNRQTSEVIQWSVLQNRNNALKWSIPVFNVIRNDIDCSVFMVVWKSEEETNKMCGYYLPWEKISIGSVTIQQHFAKQISQKSEFLFFFESTVLLVASSQPMKIILSNGIMTSSLRHSLGWNYFIVGSNVMNILELNITFYKIRNNFHLKIFIHD